MAGAFRRTGLATDRQLAEGEPLERVAGSSPLGLRHVVHRVTDVVERRLAHRELAPYARVEPAHDPLSVGRDDRLAEAWREHPAAVDESSVGYGVLQRGLQHRALADVHVDLIAGKEQRVADVGVVAALAVI